MSRSFTDRMAAGLLVGGVAASMLSLMGEPWPLRVDGAFVAHLTGMLAGYLSAVIVVLMSRTPLLEHRIGADVMVRWHALAGRLFLLLVLVHAGAAVEAWAVARHQDVLAAVLTVLRLPGLVAAVFATTLFVLVAVGSVRAARRRVPYEFWHALHLLTYVAICLSFLHELAGPNLAGRPAVQVAWTLMHGYAIGLAVRYRFVAPLEGVWRHRLVVDAVVPEADGVVSVLVRGSHVDELGAEAGQFFRWRFLAPGLWSNAYPFSLSAAPQGDRLRITVKALGEGSRLVHTVQPGTRVLAEGPYGAMTAQRRTRPCVLLIAGGVGITPMRALFETIDIGAGRLTLLYRSTTPEDVIFRDEIAQIAAWRGAEVIWMVGPSSDLGLQMTADNLLRLVPDVTERDVYLCASPRMSASTRQALCEAGLPLRQLHEEMFAF